jgi:hypothetical protein
MQTTVKRCRADGASSVVPHFYQVMDAVEFNLSSGVKWELGFVHFWLGKWDSMHWDRDSSPAKNSSKWEWD